MNPLIVVPTYLTLPVDLEVTRAMLESLRRTEPEVGVLVVDDGSPASELVDEMAADMSRLEFDLQRQPSNEGFSTTVNVGLRRALNEGRDAVLVNADIEFIDANWCKALAATRDPDDKLASVVGGLLLYPTDLIQHAGIFFSLLHRCFDHRYKFAPHNLPEAQHKVVCPVTGALQFIRHDCLAEVGIYDENFRLGWEDVDYCIRAWQAGRSCVMNPQVRAYHHESLFRGRPSPKVADWQARSWIYFCSKHSKTSFAEFVPTLV